MALKLFELVGTDVARPFSPFCWRTRMALAHKGLSAQTIPWCFTDKDAIAPHNSEKVPVLIDGETSVADSWTIANYLEDSYPDRPSLFGGEGGRALGQAAGTSRRRARQIRRGFSPDPRADAADLENASLSRRQCAELCRLH